MYCKYCGEQLAEGASFCHRCGKKNKKEKVAVRKTRNLYESEDFVDVETYWKELGLLKKLCFLIAASAAALWAAILVLSFFI